MELSAQYVRNTLVQSSKNVDSTNENQTQCSCDDRVWSEFFDLGTGGDYLYESKLWSHDRVA